MKKSLLWLLVSLISISMIAAFSLTGCKEAVEEAAPAEEVEEVEPGEEVAEEITEEEVEKVQVTVYGWLTSYAKEFSEVFAARVAEVYPNIELVFQESTYEETGTQYLLMAESGDVPDVAYCELIMSNELAVVGALEDLGTMLSQDVIDDLPESVYNACLYDGTLVSIMWDISPYALFTASSLATEAGYDGPPRTIDEFEQMIYDIAALGTDDQGNKIWGTNIAGMENEVHIPFLMSPWIYNFGGNFFDQETGEAVVNSPEVVAVFEMFKQMYDDEVFGPVPVGREQDRQLFAQLNAGAIGEGPWQRGLWRDISGQGEAFDDQWWLDTYPTMDGSPGKSLLWSSNAAIMKGAEHPEEAAKVIEMWVSDPEVVLAFGELQGGIPAVKSIQNLAEVQNDPYRKVFVDEINAGGNLPFAPHVTKITPLSSAFSVAFLDIMLNDAPIQETLDDLNAEMESIVAE